MTAGKLIPVILLFSLLLAVSCASADDGTVQTVSTTVAGVRYYNPRSAMSYCYIRLANGRTLTNVYGAECRARPGQTVTLRYTSYCRPLIGCQPRLTKWDLR